MHSIEFLHFERGKVMKKILSIMLGLVLVLSMVSALVVSTSAATDSQVLRVYDRASDGDILFYANFNSEAYKMNASAEQKIDFEISEDGRTLTATAKPNSGSDNASYFGAYFDELAVGTGAQVTMTFKIKSNGFASDKATPTSNSVGVGGWFIDDYMTKDPETGWKFINYYGNWNCDLPEGTLHRSGIRIANKTKLAADANNIEPATADEDGFLTVKIEYDYEKTSRKVTTYFLQDGVFVEDQSCSMSTTEVVNNAKTDDHLGFAISGPHVECDATVTDVKIFKGLGLTPEQLAITENTTPEVEPVATTTKAKPSPVVQTTAAPATEAPADDEAAGGCGGSLALATVAIVPAVAAVAFVSSKKRED